MIEVKILATLGTVLQLGGLIPILMEIAGEERTGRWLATVVAPAIKTMWVRLPTLLVPTSILVIWLIGFSGIEKK